MTSAVAAALVKFLFIKVHSLISPLEDSLVILIVIIEGEAHRNGKGRVIASFLIIYVQHILIKIFNKALQNILADFFP